MLDDIEKIAFAVTTPISFRLIFRDKNSPYEISREVNQEEIVEEEILSIFVDIWHTIKNLNK